jgi:ferredoxin
MDKNRPQTVDTSAHLKGTLSFQITRAFHLAGRCVSCGACERACPAGIKLSLLNLSLARAAQEEFGVRPGTDPGDDLLVGGFSAGDREGFIK